ncbi:hexulose-6-phosphate isomerase [Paenibacillus sp. yr247]|nr:hexulose-6-phosphate isomerase [Paenibacillus sp. yr247]
MSMLKGIGDWPFRHVWTGKEIIENASKMKFNGIEFNIYESDGPINLHSSPAMVKELAAHAADYGIELPSLSTVLHNQYSLTSADKNIRKQGEEIVLRMIEMASQLGAKTILVVPGHVSADVPYDQAYAVSQETLIRLVPSALSAGITIGIENVWNKFLLSPLEFVRFLDEMNHPSIKAYLDIGNARIAGFPDQWIRLLEKRLASVHVKDIRRSTKNDYGVVPLFNGDVDWPAVIRTLHEVNYDGYLIATPAAYSILPERLIHTASQDLTAIMELQRVKGR